VEKDYLGVLSDEVPLDAWRLVIRKALEDAQNGCPRARQWLSTHLLGDPRPDQLMELAASEMWQDTDDEIRARANCQILAAASHEVVDIITKIEERRLSVLSSLLESGVIDAEQAELLMEGFPEVLDGFSDDNEYEKNGVNS
jgi:hypothetical protein